MKQFIVPDYMIMDSLILDQKEETLHSHKNIELFYLIEGCMDFYLEDAVLKLEKEDFILVPSNCPHRFSAAKKVIYLCLHINYDTALHYLDIGSLRCTLAQSRENTYAIKTLRRMLQEIIKLYLVKNEILGILLPSIYYKLLYYLADNFAETDPAITDSADIDYQRKIKIIGFISDHYRSPVKLGDLAHNMHLSEAYLSKYIKRILGVNFLEYLTDYRLEKAAGEIVSYPERNVMRIAMDNGFPNMVSFHKAFRQKYGMTPSDYAGKYQALRKKQDQKSLQANQFLKGQTEPFEIKFDEMTDTSFVTCDARLRNTYCKHWNKMVNIGPAHSLLRSDIQEHVRLLCRELGFGYVRIWDLYSQDFILNINEYPKNGGYDFSKADRVFDFLAENKLLPYIDIGFKPLLLLKGVQNPLVEESRPDIFQDLKEFEVFWKEFMRHYGRRYGTHILNQWYFELWYDSWNGSPDKTKEYLSRFQRLTGIIKSAAPEAKIGGPGEDVLALLKESDNYVGLCTAGDFISVYSYSLNNENRKLIEREDFLKHYFEELRTVLTPLGIQDKEIHISEWGMTVSNRNFLNDSTFKGAFLVKECLDTMGTIDLAGCWLGTDLYAEFSDEPSILFGGAGLLTRDGIKKPAFYGMEFMNRLDKYVIGADEYTVITTDGRGDIKIVCHNYKHPSTKYFNMENATHVPEDSEVLFVEQNTREINYEIEYLEAGKYMVKSRMINQNLGSIQDELLFMKQMKELSREDISYLRSICIPRVKVEYHNTEGGLLRFSISLKPNEIRYIHIVRIDP